MKLCGLNIPYNDQYREKTAANRVHEAPQTAEACLRGIDGPDLGGSLRNLVADVQGIIRAVESGSPRDVQGSIIDRATVQGELSILNQDVQTVIGKVREEWAKTAQPSERWKGRWNGDAVMVHSDSVSILGKLEELGRAAERMQSLSR